MVGFARFGWLLGSCLVGLVSLIGSCWWCCIGHVRLGMFSWLYQIVGLGTWVEVGWVGWSSLVGQAWLVRLD